MGPLEEREGRREAASAQEGDLKGAGPEGSEASLLRPPSSCTPGASQHLRLCVQGRNRGPVQEQKMPRCTDPPGPSANEQHLHMTWSQRHWPPLPGGTTLDHFHSVQGS